MTETPYLGELEELTLLALLRLQESPSGSDVRDELAHEAARRVSPSTVYLTLMRLEDKGLCRSWLADAEAVPGGKGRRHYRIEAAGVEALRRSRDIRRRMWDGFETLADRALGEG